MRHFTYWHVIAVLFSCWILSSSAEDETLSEEKSAKLLPIFNVITFPNSMCSGGSRNGTCYTAEECSNKGGTKDGSCADGFGVCCTFTLSCGGTSSENCTYLEMGTSTTAQNCQYSICKCDSSVCRIRLDFTTFVLASPAGRTEDNAAVGGGPEQGDCSTDSFTVGGVMNTPPVICGTNTGQHIYLDAQDGVCAMINFQLGSGSTTQRSWAIKTTQYGCNTDNGGPTGCLQYFTAATGSFRSFNLVPPAGTMSIHLSNQDYNICFRRAINQCVICFNTAADGDFGLTNPAIIANTAEIDSNCAVDYVEVEGLTTLAIAAMNVVTPGFNRICGRIFGTSAGTAGATVCTRSQPFKMRFVSDGGEVVPAAAPAGITSELFTPGGIRGFNLMYTQSACA